MKKLLENYEVEDFVTNESFINYYFQSDEFDTAFWRKWIDQHPEKKGIVSEAILVIEFLSLSLSDKEYKQERLKIKNITDKSICNHNKPFVEWGKKNFSFDGYYKAMPYLIIFLAIISYAAYFFSRISVPENNKNTEVFNQGKNTLDVVLKDSTIVTLAAGSQLNYYSSFGNKNREVYLKGEAKFNVKRNERLPFKVFTNNIVTTVLGTVFNIRKRGDSGCMVELLKGKLKVELQEKSKSMDSIFLEPNENAVYDYHNNHIYKTLSSTCECKIRSGGFELFELAENTYR